MTSILFVPAKYTRNILIPNDIIEKIPQRLMIFSSVQFLNQLPNVTKQLNEKGKKVLTIKSENFLYEGMISEKGQLLGCNVETLDTKKYSDKFDAFMYIGDGIFHPQALLIYNYKDIYCYDPKIKRLNVLKKELHDEIQKHVKGSILKFLTSKNIGIVVTTKRGQNNHKRAELLRSKILKKWSDRKVFMFICNEINFQELENFNFIDIYVNSACPRIGHDDIVRSPKPIINIGDAESVL